MMAYSSRTHEDYQIGVICALATEKAAMVAMLIESHPKLKKEKGDENEYTLGKIGVHNVVIACLPAGIKGNTSAAIVAKDMQRSFPIRFGLMVGVGGGVWSKTDDIRLGDVVVSQPTGTHGGVVQWDFGKTGKDGDFQRTGSLDKPPPVLLHALEELKTFDITDGVNLEESLSVMIQNKPRMGRAYRYQGADHDQLFEATYDHEGDETCDGCDFKLLVQRPAREDSAPRIHYGNIASGNEVMKHGTTRDRIAREESVICFEMEAAGLMDNFRCLVIRGICDYADSHKNKIWQPYAAAVAAAFARALLDFIDKQEVIKTPFIAPPQASSPSYEATSISKHNMATNMEPLDLAYARSMNNHPYGTALYTPLSFRTFHPGICGYFDSHSSWNPVADLSDPNILSLAGYSPVPETLNRAPSETDFQWGPKISESTRAQKLSLESGISAALARTIPLDIKAWYKFSSANGGGAVLLTKSPMRHERFYHESPFKGWVRDNAVKLVETRKEILQFGLWIVTSTWGTQECAINVWNETGKSANVGFRKKTVEIGEFAPSGEWWVDGRDDGWVQAKAVEGDDGRIVFFGGLRFQYRRIPFGDKLKSDKKQKSYRGGKEGRHDMETLVEVVISDEQVSGKGEMFAIDCESISGKENAGDETEENEEW